MYRECGMFWIAKGLLMGYDLVGLTFQKLKSPANLRIHQPSRRTWMRKALSIGINDYPGEPLFGCANDARVIANALATHENGAPNFSVKLCVDGEAPKNPREIRALVDELFSGVADVALFYFAGHGQQNAVIGESSLCLPDDNEISLSEILAYANSDKAKAVREKVIVLDCCSSGGAGGGLLAQGLFTYASGRRNRWRGDFYLTVCPRARGRRRRYLRQCHSRRTVCLY
jgi:Caspase domain